MEKLSLQSKIIQIKFHVNKGSGVINQISIVVSYTFKKWFNLFQLICDQTYTIGLTFIQIFFLFYRQTEYDTSLYSPNGLDYIHKTNITLKEHMRIKDLCKNHPSDHYILTTGTLEKLGINMNGSTIEAYTQAKPQETSSLSNVSYISIVNTKHWSSGIGSSKRENITKRWNMKNILFSGSNV